MATDYSSNANIVFCFPMKADESPIQDASANNHDGTLDSADNPDYSTDAPTDYDAGSYVFTSDKIDMGDHDDFSPHAGASGKMSIVAWVKFSSVTAETWPPYWIITKGNSNQYEFGIGQCGNGSSARLLAVFWQSNADNIVSVTTDTQVTTGVWYHIAVVYDRATPKLEVFLNGVSDGSNATFVSANTSNGTASLQMGARADGSANYPGSITEIAMFSDLLSQSEIQEIKDYGLKGDQGAAGEIMTDFVGVTA